MVLSFISALGGSLLALSIDNPEVVVTERVVEVEPSPALPELAPGDREAMVALYVDMAGEDDQWTEAVVDEIISQVCGGTPSPAAVFDNFAPGDISLTPDEFEVFIEQVRAVCPD